MVIYDWATQSDLVCDLISQTKRFLKIVLKTKNEIALLDWWLQHHLRFGDDGSIIVFDNESTEPIVFDIYKKYQKNLTVIQYSGKFNAVHDFNKFCKLYEALRASSDFYTFVDTDERLYFTDGLNFYADEQSIKSLIPGVAKNEFFCGYWAQGVPLKDNRIDFGHTALICQGRFNAAKPILPSSFEPKGFINHTFQLLKNNPDAIPLPGFVVCHHKFLDLQRRVDSNVGKIISFEWAKGVDEIVASLSSIETSAKNEQHAAYLLEICACLAGASQFSNQQGDIEIQPDGTLLFLDDAARRAISRYVFNFKDFLTFTW